ncbi:MAG: DUF1365 domain-containing protein [Planctomycetota bacterium]
MVLRRLLELRLPRGRGTVGATCLPPARSRSMTTRASCIYRGRVRHRRREPREHHFNYGLFLLYLDLDELAEVFAGRWLWSVGRRNVAAWHRGDYLGESETSLRDAVCDRAEQELGRRPRGPVRMLTHLRYWGYCFNPVTFYYCFEPGGLDLDCVVAEITNTPWGERHSYVLDARRAEVEPGGLRWTFDKTFHVSPFMSMDHEYDWCVSVPGDGLSVTMLNRNEGRVHFEASMQLRRQEITGPALAGVLAAHPFMTGKIIAGIHWQALRLWWKRIPFHSHPKHCTHTRDSKETTA